ncbi:hypothetical protein K491DRAFT_602793 [Lophiostoma macrostomum CBS 122681]|uniref:Zn(2)-C6 fungal-type domain-containing protein n=1 Tax=Lophiostoma macrostomum CBS 122681 TaxID=1314788 RepID=A0A6A6T0D4_9PLEO|nr:hypothetical protein K491DRAFT_602793 [Lophiostoma macrostomum CBS 122681]
MSDDILHSSNSHDRVQKSNSISGASSTPNPRSCVTCRKRKVKCDKKQPCSNCARAKIECIFPGPGRAPRKSRKAPDGELMDRLRKLEGVVQTLNAQVEEHEQEAADKERRGSSGECPYGSGGSGSSNSHRSASVAVDSSVDGLESRFGRLVVDQGRSRYVNNSFWASLNNEVEDLKAILVEPSDDEEDSHDSPDSTYSAQHQAFLFGYSSTNVDMFSLHPSPDRALHFWTVFKENVDPLVKVLHIPSFEPVFLDAITHLDNIPRSLECLMFAIYYGAVTSIMQDECRQLWGEDRQSMLNRYRFGLEQALARANFLYCDEIIILQAFVTFLILLRRNDDARKIWTLTGLVVRIAQTLGIHRDGSHFDLPVFEVEMRRRLWWQVLILDARASEDHGCDPTVVEAQFDTQMPLNVSDSDLDPSMKKFPEERTGFTDMTFCIIRFEVANIFRRILYIPPGPNRCNEFFSNLSIPEKEKWISDCHQRLEDKYLKNCDMSIPLYWVTATLSRLVMSKMWLIVYHPHQRRDGGASLPQETKDKLFITSLENIEYSMLLETEARTMKWGWLFRTYVQWHAIAFLLSELCVRTKGEAVERAWRALEATAGRWWFPIGDNAYRKGRQGCLWKPLRKLMAKARAAREKEIALERASQALKNRGVVYQDLPQLLEQMPEPPQLDQPSPENLDRLLRPSAPRLGEMPNANPPSWAGSPVVPDLAIPTASALAASFSESVTASRTSRSPEVANTFNHLSSLGLDFVLQDVMDGMAFDGTTTYDSNHPDVRNFNAQNQRAAQEKSSDMQMHGIDGTNGFSQSPTSFNLEMNGSPTVGMNGQSSESPILDNNASMDWANWDDLVREYGMDGTPSLNGAGHLGTVSWF